MRVTVGELLKMGACSEEIDAFINVFKEDCEITPQNLFRALENNLNVFWWLSRKLPARKMFQLRMFTEHKKAAIFDTKYDYILQKSRSDTNRAFSKYQKSLKRLQRLQHDDESSIENIRIIYQKDVDKLRKEFNKKQVYLWAKLFKAIIPEILKALDLPTPAKTKPRTKRTKKQAKEVT